MRVPHVPGILIIQKATRKCCMLENRSRTELWDGTREKVQAMNKECITEARVMPVPRMPKDRAKI